MSAPYTMESLQALADDGVHLLEVDDADLVATVQECDALRARVAELERELEGMRQRARVAEAQRDEARREWAVVRRDESTQHARALKAERDAARLREAMEALVDRIDFVSQHDEYRAVWECAQLHRGPYRGPTYEHAFNAARAALASAPSAEPTPRDMRVAEAVRKACARSAMLGGLQWGPDDFMHLFKRKVDLAAVVAKALEVGT